MIPWVQLDAAPVPGSTTGLRLMRRGAEFSIMIGGNELMNSRLSGSEEALATLAAERMGEKAAPQVLIGGLGMGFTLRAALAAFRPGARITVAELVPAVVAWARGPMAEVFGDSLADARVRIEEGDVAVPIAGGEARFDAVLLDVDNGPDGLTSAANDGLYGAVGLARARRALKPGGVLGIWSSAPDPRFTARLGQAGFEAEEVRVSARGRGGGKGRGGARHTLWFGTRRR